MVPIENGGLFPGGLLPMRSWASSPIAQLSEASAFVIVAALRVHASVDPRAVDVYEVGTLGRIQDVRRSDSVIDYKVHGLARVRLHGISEEAPLRARVPRRDALPLAEDPSLEVTRALALQILHRTPPAPAGPHALVRDLDTTTHLVDLLAPNIGLPVADQQRVLATVDLTERVALTHSLLRAHLAALPAGSVVGAQCPLHLVPAVKTCERCGTFMCDGCLGKDGLAVQCRACLRTIQPRPQPQPQPLSKNAVRALLLLALVGLAAFALCRW